MARRALVALALIAACALGGGRADAEPPLGRSSGAHPPGDITLRSVDVLDGAGQLLDGPWRFFADDDMRYAARDLPLGASMGTPWASTMDPVPPAWRGRGWFRTRVIVPDALQGRPLALATRFRGAIEIYIDGARVMQLGDPSARGDDAAAVACLRPRIVNVTLDAASHVIAVRLHNSSARKLARLGYGGGFDVAIGDASRLRARWQDTWAAVSRLHVLFYGVTMGLAALHFLLFLFYRERPANLYFAIAAASIATLARGIEMSSSTTTVQGIFDGNALFNASVAVGCVYFQRFYYQVFLERPPRYYVAFVVIGVLLAGGAYWLPYRYADAFSLAAFVEQLVTLGRGVAARRPGARIIGVGGVAAIAATAYAIFVDLGYIPGNAHLFLVGFLVLCASMSVHLAREIAADKRLLGEQLVEIQRLSQETLAREREAADERLARDAAAAANRRHELELAEARERQKAVDALARANDELSRAQAQLVQTEKMASLGELVDGVARQIDEPVAHIVARAAELKRTCGALSDALDASDEARDDRRLQRSLAALTEAARVIDDGGQRVAVIAERLAQFGRVESAEDETLRVDALVDEAVELLATRFAAAGVELERSGLSDVPAVTGHRRQLVVLLRQLLDNALQAVGERDGASRVSVTATTRDDDGAVAIAVSDDGVGVKAEDRARIFDPGFTTRGVGVGAGLGLAIAYRVARAHGGDLALAEPSLWPGERSPSGATFVVTLRPADAVASAG